MSRSSESRHQLDFLEPLPPETIVSLSTTAPDAPDTFVAATGSAASPLKAGASAFEGDEAFITSPLATKSDQRVSPRTPAKRQPVTVAQTPARFQQLDRDTDGGLNGIDTITQGRNQPQSVTRKRSHDPEGKDDSDGRSSLKRTRILPARRHYLEFFEPSVAPISTGQPPSPLFFSPRGENRPHLVARFSSSEAAVEMLSKANNEEGQVRTVSLPRGTVFTPLPGGVQVRAVSERSSAARSASPESAARAGEGQGPASALGSIGVVELLEQDERPTMIVDLAENLNYGTGPLRPLFLNSSLRAISGLLDSVTGNTEGSTPGGPPDLKFLQFKSWLLSASIDGESLNVCLPSYKYAGLSWSCSTLRKRFRLLSGTPAASFTSPGLSLSKSPQASGTAWMHRQASARTAPAIAEEAPDYFGMAAVPHRPQPTPHTSSSEVVSTTEIPKAAYQLSTDPTPVSAQFSVGTLDASEHMSTDEFPVTEGPSFDWTRIPVSDAMSPHIQFARSIDWSATALGPIETWSTDLRQMCSLIMASPHPAAMYWGPELVALYNEAYIMLAGQKHPTLMGQSYKEAWKEIWDEVKGAFDSARNTGEATMKDDDCLFIKRNDYLEETYFSWSIIPIVGSDGSVAGLYNPAFEKTRRKIAERRMLTLREIGEKTAAARDVYGFWRQALSALEYNEYDAPFVLLYSVSDDTDSESTSMHSASLSQGQMLCHLEGSLGISEGHPSAPNEIDLRTGADGFGEVFREVLKAEKPGPILLEAGTKQLPSHLLEGLQPRGFGDKCRAVVVCPIHPTTGETVLGFLVLGVNPRRPYDEDYSLFLQLLTRQLATSLASVVLFEEEIRRGQRAAKLAALDRIELSEQLAARTQEAIDSETKFTRMAEFAPVGIFTANSEGMLTYCNDTWYDISRVSRRGSVQAWMDYVASEDRQIVERHWNGLFHETKPITATFRFQTPWQDPDGTTGERWVLFSAYPERGVNGRLKSIFGSITDISKQKWAEGLQKRKVEEANELKQQRERFIDSVSHEMRNPLSAILQCSDEIASTVGGIKTREARDAKTSTQVDDGLANAIEAAETIALCAQHQKRIVDDILTMSKLDSELLLVTPVDAQPLTVVQRALTMHKGEFASNGIRSEFVVDKSYTDLKIDWVRFDPSRVMQVLINLTTNAIKFTGSESIRTIVVSLAASVEKPSERAGKVVEYFPSRRVEKVDQGDDWGDGAEVYIQFSVRDTGRGLTADEKKALFQRFSQASPKTHVQYGGSGLGLFISRQLTELQGGEIGVASEAGKGSTFAFYVRARRSQDPTKARRASRSQPPPPAAAAPVVAPPAPEPKPSKPLGTKHILLVEDNLVNQRVLQKQLKNLGCIVQVANHGGEALDKLKQSTWFTDPDANDDDNASDRTKLSVVLMDQEMPVMDGLTATKKIRLMELRGQLKGHVPVIAVTANARSEQIQTALDAGMDDVVSKPFRIPDLIPKIEELMGRHPEPGTE